MSEEEQRLPGGNVGGAVRVGDTVRRSTGPWTPDVHALLRHLAGRLPGVPRVLGYDEAGREVLSYLPGRVPDIDTETLTPGQLTALVRWTRAFHTAVAGFPLAGAWRYFPMPDATLIGHNDIAPYNACFDGDELVGVFDWDLAGPSNPLMELAFVAWNGVPLWRDDGPETAAARLRLIADAYRGYAPERILRAVPDRIRIMLDGIPVAAAAGDRGMANLLAQGEPERSRRSLADLERRLPAIERSLAQSRRARRQLSGK
ncbi:phosphotransferase [Plantactinospora siamensis]|uniref:Phosphotransferase n=1 Tax=Plantactinospora siamensis TaxID=555372 RepID=A0ABV6NY17_9ACTN